MRLNVARALPGSDARAATDEQARISELRRLQKQTAAGVARGGAALGAIVPSP